MRVIERIADLTDALEAERAAGRTVGLVPTMGALHDGHASLVARAAAECEVVCTTVFVNPLQFAAGEDLDAYPSDLDGDVRIAGEAGATLVFAPALDEMFPGEVLTTVHVAGLTEVLDGRSRPTHFDGVATVVAKLFAMAGRCRAYFGEKDFQQLAVVRCMAADLSFPVEVVGCPTVRAHDGLALSSRNAYLTPEEREAAPVLVRALRSGAAAIRAGERDPAEVRALMGDIISAEPTAELDHADVVDAATLRTPDTVDGDLRLLVAARFGKARLIDNVGVTA
ncbi:MAG TPA: pantoate--beta-alanine ligase [Acidimicrobiales bacterium]|nr:pantoate--beta-alanine ligase [Acidimicrobiales bacterium]